MSQSRAHLIAAPLAIALALSGCGINWQRIADALPGPNPTPTPIPEPTPDTPPDPPTPPSVTPTPACGFPAGLPPFEEIAAAPLYREIVREAAQSCLGCEPGTAGCVWPGGPVDAYACTIAALQAEGYCAGRYDDDRSGAYSGSDALCVKAAGAEEYHEWKLINFGGSLGRHASSLEHVGAFRLTSQPVVEPPAESEPAPCPTVGRIDLGVMWLAARSIDATPKALGLETCTALGFVDRRECPLGGELEGRPNPDRIRCEAEAGPYVATIDGQPVGTIGDNPLLFWAGRAGEFRVCSRAGICASKVLD